MQTIEMVTNIREYTRKMTKAEIKDLKQRYASHFKRSRRGFLHSNTLELLLHMKNWPEDTTNEEVSKFFHEIREHARAAIDDFGLLSEVLTEKQIQSIFGEKIDEKNQEPIYPISLLIESLLPLTLHRKRGVIVSEILEEQEWRKFVLQDIAIKSLLWYIDSGIFKTDSHKRLLIDAADAIAIMSSGERPWYFRPDEPLPGATR